jgi:hypothetical protein
MQSEAEHKKGSTLGGRRQPTKPTTGQRYDSEFKDIVSTPAVRSRVALDANDPGIERAIQRLQRKSFILDGLIPEIQCLLRVPSHEAKSAYLQALAQYGLVCMLIIASLLGTALSPLEPENYPTISPNLVAVFNVLSMVICTACLSGTCIFLLEGIIMEGTPERRVHGIIAKADSLFHFGTCMVGVGIQLTVPLILIRGWISGLPTVYCIVVTVVCAGIHGRMMFVYFNHLQTNWPVEAQRWTKLFFPPLYRQKASNAAIDELVAELRSLQQPREKSPTARELGKYLEKYFKPSSTSGDGTWDLEMFLQLVEKEAGGRLTPVAERIAQKAFEKTLEAKLDSLAEEAMHYGMAESN